MHHDFFDKYKNINSAWSEINPLIRFLISLSFVITLSVAPFYNWYIILFHLFVLLFILFLSKLPEVYFLKRTILLSLPALIIAVSASFVKENPLEWMIFIFSKAYLSIGIMVIIVSTASFPSLINALEKIRIPGLIIALLGFLYRYSFLFIDELESLERAFKSRATGKNLRLKKTAVSNIAATLFRVSLERSERVYQAMLSRGFTGSFKFVPADKISVFQIIILAVFILLLIGVQIIV